MAKGVDAAKGGELTSVTQCGARTVGELLAPCPSRPKELRLRYTPSSLVSNIHRGPGLERGGALTWAAAPASMKAGLKAIHLFSSSTLFPNLQPGAIF